MPSADIAAMNIVISSMASVALFRFVRLKLRRDEVPTSAMRLLMVSASWLILSVTSYVTLLR